MERLQERVDPTLRQRAIRREDRGRARLGERPANAGEQLDDLDLLKRLVGERKDVDVRAPFPPNEKSLRGALNRRDEVLRTAAHPQRAVRLLYAFDRLRPAGEPIDNRKRSPRERGRPVEDDPAQPAPE